MRMRAHICADVQGGQKRTLDLLALGTKFESSVSAACAVEPSFQPDSIHFVIQRRRAYTSTEIFKEVLFLRGSYFSLKI